MSDDTSGKGVLNEHIQGCYAQVVAGGYLLALLSLGITIGSTWPELFKGWTPFLFLLFLISGGYVAYVWLKPL
jgi:hypothetical protein